MATKKVYPFIHATMWNPDFDEGENVVFDAREVESYSGFSSDADKYDDDDLISVRFKSGTELGIYLGLDQEIYPGDNLITAIDKVQYSHFWHDNEDSAPDEGED